jgi:two-component system NarL family response regulator
MRALIVDDHHLFLEGLRILLSGGEIEVVGMAHDGFEALHLARSTRPDLILMDVKMPRCNGVEATRLIKAEMPDCKIVMLTMSEDEDDLFEAIKSGANGYLLKNLKTDHLMAYLRDSQAGRAVFSDGVATRILDEFRRAASRPQTPRGTERGDHGDEDNPLSPEQMTILTLISQGQTYKQVAQSVGISERTVKYHMAEIIERLHVANRAQAIAYAAELRRKQPDDSPVNH